jgi:all-trans-retinol 13,14-reductase
MILSAPNTLYAGTRESTPLYTHALITDHYLSGAYRFIGGSEQLAVALRKQIEKYGGEIIEDDGVEEFEFNEKTITSAVLKSGNKVYADRFISAIHPSLVMKMVPDGILKKAYRKRIENLPNTISYFNLNIKIKKGFINKMKYNFYYAPVENFWAVEMEDSGMFPYGFSMFPVYNEENTDEVIGASILVFMKYEYFKKWENTSVGRRGDDYKKYKKELADKILGMVEDAIPGIIENIEGINTSSPLTLRDYTGSIDGSIYGVMKDCRNPLETFVFPKTKIPNLLLTGQNLNLHGIKGVAATALLTCKELISLNDVINKINTY